MRGIEESMKNGHMLRQDFHEITVYIPLQVTVMILCKTTVFFTVSLSLSTMFKMVILPA